MFKGDVNKRALVGWSGALGVAALVMLLVGLVAAAPQATVAQMNTASPRTISVTGSGEVTAPPDVAHVTIGVQAQAATVNAALQDANTRMAAVLKALRSAGIAENDMQTGNFSINFQPPEPGSAEKPAPPERPGAYQVNNSVSVTVRDVSKVGDVIDAAAAAGSNDISGISFDLTDTTALASQARAKAMDDASVRARDLARLAGVTLGEVMSVREAAGFPGPRPMASAASLGASTPVLPGQVSYTTQVEVVYAIQ
jgi:uncharacterized protein